MLAELLEEQEALTPAPAALSEFLRAMPVLPLFHRLGEPLRRGLILEVAASKAARAEIGTDCCLFASVGVAAYFDPPLTLAFGPMCDVREGRRSAPWDTMGLRNYPGYDPSTHAFQVARYSIPAPDDEEFLAHWLARVFDCLHTWLSGGRPTGRDVLDVIGSLKRKAYDSRTSVEQIHESQICMTTPEARYDRPMDLSGDLLLAAFADADFPGGRADGVDWGRTYALLEKRLEDRFFRLRRDVGPPDLRGEAYRWVRAHLAQEGVR